MGFVFMGETVDLIWVESFEVSFGCLCWIVFVQNILGFGGGCCFILPCISNKFDANELWFSRVNEKVKIEYF